MPAIITTPAARGLNTLGRPKAPRHYNPRPSVPLKSFVFHGDGTAHVTSGRSEETYEQVWTRRNGQLDVLSCGCIAGYRDKACDHWVQTQAALDAVTKVLPAGSVLRQMTTENREADGSNPRPFLPCKYCQARRVHVSAEVLGRGPLSFLLCLGCGLREVC